MQTKKVIREGAHPTAVTVVTEWSAANPGTAWELHARGTKVLLRRQSQVAIIEEQDKAAAEGSSKQP